MIAWTVAGKRHIAWTRDLFEAMRPFAQGVYVNYLGTGDAPDRVRSAYGEKAYARLVDLKVTYDPDNVFSATQNIPPARH